MVSRIITSRLLVFEVWATLAHRGVELGEREGRDVGRGAGDSVVELGRAVGRALVVDELLKRRL